VLFDSVIEGFWLAKRRTLSENTVRDYTVTFSRLREFVGAGTGFEQIGSEQIHKFLNHLRDKIGLGDKTLANAWIAMSSLWSWAEVELGIPHALRGSVQRPSYRLPQIEPYSKADVGAMLNACEKSAGWDARNGNKVESRRDTALRDRTILLVLLDTGVRASELCDFVISDYDSKRGRLMVRKGKGKKQRVVFLGMNTRKVLWRYLADRPDAKQGDPLFATRGGQPLDRNGLRHMIQRCAARGGVMKATVHRFRHTFAITFLRNGGSVLQLQALLGHEKLETIRIYAKLAEMDLERAQEVASPVDGWDFR